MAETNIFGMAVKEGKKAGKKIKKKDAGKKLMKATRGGDVMLM
ncbi:MAG: hypothetical protein Q7R76_05685 [Candidatus Woesearchaeota archaeon]|nr:hypothetical protein [Candidatus Woesearchaeota archaeon]